MKSDDTARWELWGFVCEHCGKVFERHISKDSWCPIGRPPFAQPSKQQFKNSGHKKPLDKRVKDIKL